MEWQHSSSCRRRVPIQRLSDDHERFVEKGLTAVNGDGLPRISRRPIRTAPSHELCHWGDDHLNGPAVVGLAARIRTPRNRFINRTIDVVDGQDNTPFVCAVMAAEGTSLVTNLGTG